MVIPLPTLVLRERNYPLNRLDLILFIVMIVNLLLFVVGFVLFWRKRPEGSGFVRLLIMLIQVLRGVGSVIVEITLLVMINGIIQSIVASRVRLCMGG